MRSKTRVALGRGAEAEADALEYCAARPDDADGWLALGDARLAMGPPKAGAQARAAFAKAAAILGPGDPRPSLGEGWSFLVLRKPREALAALTAAAEDPKKHRAEILATRSRAHSSLGDWAAASDDLGRAIPDLERRLEDRRRIGAAKAGVDAARLTLADAYWRRGLAGEALDRKAEALLDHKQACGLGLPAACARVASLEKPQPKPKPAPKAPPKPKRKKNPKGDSGERIYAN
ncbi:MAG: hypothetical protein M0D55_11895 [Elusimicrobiota bacterium]|nr:MAG: hypothetical protein M0D55_11895 [Elusimicrobiota bacterium]